VEQSLKGKFRLFKPSFEIRDAIGSSGDFRWQFLIGHVESGFTPDDKSRRDDCRGGACPLPHFFAHTIRQTNRPEG